MLGFPSPSSGFDNDERVPPHTHPGQDIVLQLARFSGDCEISPRAVESSTAVVVAPAEGD